MGIIAAIIVFFVLSSKITNLAREIELLKGGKFVSTAPTPLSQDSLVTTSTEAPSVLHSAVMVPQQDQILNAVPARQMLYQPPQESAFEKWIKEDFFVKLGALLLLIGFGWFVSYAFAHQWIGPIGRITLGLLSGLGIMIFGTYRIRTYLHQGSVFIVLGLTIVLLTVFGAREIYDFFTPATSLLIMFLAVSFVAYVSVVYKNTALAFASLCLASIAPFLTNSPNPDIVVLFSYLLVVILGTLWVVHVTGARALTFAALVIAFFYGLPFLVDTLSSRESDIALLFSFIFTAIFFVTNIISIVHPKNENLAQVHVSVAVGTGLYLVVWIFAAAPDVFQSLLCAMWMLVFGLGTFVVYRSSSNRIPFYIYSAVSIGLLGAATAAELEGPVLAIAYTIEAALVIALAHKLVVEEQISKSIHALMLIPMILSLESLFAPSWQNGFLHGDFFVLSVLALALFGLSGLLFEKVERQGKDFATIAHALAISGTVYMLAIIWLVLHSLYSDDVATMFSLFSFTIIGITLFIIGRVQAQKIMNIVGGVLLGFVVLHLLIIDVWQMELAGRIITFGAIGTLLISTAFIKPPQKTPLNESVS